MQKRRWISRGLSTVLAVAVFFPGIFGSLVVDAGEKGVGNERYENKAENVDFTDKKVRESQGEKEKAYTASGDKEGFWEKESKNRSTDEKSGQDLKKVVPSPVKTADRRVLASSGNGRYTGSMNFSVTSKSTDGYTDDVSFSIKHWKTSGKGRHDSGNADVVLSASGNECTVELSNLLDYESYTVEVNYKQTYYYDVPEKKERKNAYGEWEEYTDYIKMSGETSGTLTDTIITSEDRLIRNAYDLREKVHKYSSLTLASSFETEGLQADIDGNRIDEWLVSGDISKVSIAGGGHTIKRKARGYIFRIYNGAELTLSDAVLHAFSGSLIRTKTYGGEYETINSTGFGEGSGIGVGFDSGFDEQKSSKGQLTLNNSTVLADNNAVVVRYGDAEIKNSYLYGMGEKDVYYYSNFEDYAGTGILVQNSDQIHAEVSLSGSSIFGRNNGMLLDGNSSATVRNCEARGDCGDAFDFRSSGNLDIRQTRIFGIIGLDIFDDICYSAVEKSLSGIHFNREVYEKITGKKGTVTVSDTSMSLNTGAFLQNAEKNSFGIQNRGNLVLGKNVTISTLHSKAWAALPEEKRAFSYGIYNCMRLELPSDIKIRSDDFGITENRNIGILRNLVALKNGTQEKGIELEKAVAKNNEISDLLDMGDNSILTISGGEITASDIGINSPYGSVYIEPEHKLTVAGKLKGIVTGRDGKDDILGESGDGSYLEINGTAETLVVSSLQGYGICVMESGRASIVGKDIEISDKDGPCGTGILNKGQLYLKNAVIKAQKAGISNHESGKAYIGDDLGEKGNKVTISGALRGIANDGTVYYYRDVVITNSIKYAVLQNGIFYMLPGAIVKSGDTGNAIFLTVKNKNGEIIRSTVRVLYEKQYEDDLEQIEASLNTASGDRNPGRVMIELYSADGTTNLSDPNYKKLNDQEKLRIAKIITGFSLCFDQINGHKSALRCGLGPYVINAGKKAYIQPKAGAATNGRTGSIVLSCLLSGSYDADFPVKVSRITSKTPEATKFYWREPQEFTTAPLSFTEDSCQIYLNNRDITAGLQQTGYRDKNKDGYGKITYDKDRLIAIYGEDHTFYSIWDTKFTMVFDGNGQTNKTANYTKKPVKGKFVFDGNNGPDGTYKDYFEKTITRKKFDYDVMADVMYQHQTSFQGFSFDKDATYKSDGIFCKGDKLHGPEEIVSDKSFIRDYSNYGAIAFYINAAEKGQLSLKKGEALVRIYAVWDEFPVLSAADSSFYADELSDESAVVKRLLSEKTVSTLDHEDGSIERKYLSVFTDPVRKTFSIDELKRMGDSGSVSIYYSLSDKNDADIKRFKQNIAVTQAKVHVLSEDAEDTTDDIPESTERGNAGTSTDTFYSAPIYVRALSLSEIDTLEPKSVWREENYRKLLESAAGEEAATTEKWVFKTDDIKKSKEFLYQKNADVITWRNKFIKNCVMDEKTVEKQKNKQLIVEEGLSSFRLTWDITSEADSADITLQEWGNTKTKTIDRKVNQKMRSGTVFSDLKPDTSYVVSARFYYRGQEQMTYKETVHTKALEKPVLSVLEKDTGKALNLWLSFDKDPRARKYVIERACIKGERKEGFKIIKEIDEFSENSSGERYFDSDVITYHTKIKSDGVYKYRVRAFGSRLGVDELSEKSEYSNDIETAFLKKPIIRSTESGCRSVRVYLKEKSAADFVRIHYQTKAGKKHYMDIKPDKNLSGIISEEMSDNTVYFMIAEAHIKSPESKKEYMSLKSDVADEKTKKLTAPELIYTDQSSIYTGSGIKLTFRYDKNAVRYEVKEVVLYPGKSEGAYKKAEIKQAKEQAYFYKKGGDSRVSHYKVRAVFTTLDQKKFYLYSDSVRAAYIKMQKQRGARIERGSILKEQIISDENASTYLVTLQGGSLEEVYVPSDRTGLSLYSPDKTRTLTSLPTVLIYDGVEYRGAR